MTVAVPTRQIVAGSALAAVVAAAGVVIGMAAVISPRIALGGAVGLAFVAVAVRSSAAGLAIFTVLSFFSVITGGSNLTIIKLAGLVLVGVAVMRVLRSHGDGNLFRDHPWLAWGAVALGVWAAASMTWALSSATAESGAFRLWQGIVLIFVVYACVRNSSDLSLVLWAFMAGVLFAAIYGVIHGPTNPNAVSRLSGGVGDPNELGAALVPSLAFAAFLFAVSTQWWKRLVLVAVMAVICPALFLTQSRGALVALAVMAVVALLFAGRMRRRGIVLVVAVAVVGITYFTLFTSAAATARITSAGSGTGRLDLWSVAVSMIQNHPVGGVGMGNFPNAAPAYTPGMINLPRFDLILLTPEVTHNTYLQILAELGTVGFLTFVGLVGGTLIVAIRTIRQHRFSDVQLTWLGRATVVAAVGMFTAYFFFSAQYEKQLWLVLGLLTAVPALAARSLDGASAA